MVEFFSPWTQLTKFNETIRVLFSKGYVDITGGVSSRVIFLWINMNLPFAVLAPVSFEKYTLLTEALDDHTYSKHTTYSIPLSCNAREKLIDKRFLFANYIYRININRIHVSLYPRNI